jgi:hypothetical protein
MELIAEGKALARWGDTSGKHSDAFGETHGER